MAPEIVNGIFALIGALIGVLGTFLITRRFQARKELTVTTSPLAKLLDVGDAVRSQVEIRFNNEVVTALSMGEIAVMNTGNQPIEKIVVTVSMEGDSKIAEFVLSGASFGFNSASVQTYGDQQTRITEIDFLNRRERIVLSYKVTGYKRPAVVVRQSGVEIIQKDELVNWIPDIYSEVVYQAFSSIPILNIAALWIEPYRLYLESRKGKRRHNTHEVETPRAGDS